MDDQLKKRAFQLADIGYWEIDVVSEELYWSDQVNQLHEVPFDVQPDLDDAINFFEEGEQRRKVSQTVTKAIEKGEPFTIESKIITAKGNRRWVRAIGETVMKNGRCTCVYGTTQDITDRKEMEQQLQRERDRLNEAQKIGGIGDWFFNVETKERTWSSNMYDIMDRNPEKGIPSYEELLSIFESQGIVLSDKVQQAIDEGRPYNFDTRLTTEAGNTKHLYVKAIPKIDNNGKVRQLHGIVQDLTERKEQEHLLQKNMKLLSQLFENAPVGLVLLDEDRSISRVNASFKEMFGYQLSEIQDKDVDSFLAPPERKQEAKDITNRTLEGDSFQVETVRQRKDGVEIPVLIATVPVDIEGEIIAIFGIYVDISQRKEAEQQLEEQLAEKKVLLAEIHHRVKNNMAVISGLLELQKDSTESNEAYQTMQDSQARIQTMSLIHEQLYQMERFSSLQFDEYVQNLGETIAATYRSNEQEVTLSYDTKSVTLDMRQAIPCGLLLNELLTNALKHAFPGRDKGRVTISLREKDDQLVTIQVKDNGIGLPENITEETNGSLGLSLVRTLTRQLEGQLEITNDNGSCFTVTFDKSTD